MQHKFQTDLFETKNIVRDDSEEIRHYFTPDGKRYPSVTSVLDITKSKHTKQGLAKWRKDIGEVEADKILKDSVNIGNRLHDECEAFISGKEATANTPREVRMMRPMFKYLQRHIEAVHGIEIPLFSHKYRLTGTCDLLATVDGVLTIVDFKNSRKKKKPEWVGDYRLQCTMYGKMVEEMYGKEVTKYRILMSCQDGTFLTFYGDTSDHHKETLSRIIKFWEMTK